MRARVSLAVTWASPAGELSRFPMGTQLLLLTSEQSVVQAGDYVVTTYGVGGVMTADKEHRIKVVLRRASA